jgi:hypothetical protein
MDYGRLMKLARKHGLMKRIDGAEHWGAGFFLLIAGNGLASPDAQSRQRSRAGFDALMRLAERDGFTQADDLRARIERKDMGERTFVLAKAALWDVDPGDLTEALHEAGFNPYLAGN